VRRRGGRKLALGTPKPMALPDAPSQCWSLGSVSDSLISGHRFRNPCVVNRYTRECLAPAADRSLSGAQVATKLTVLIGMPPELLAFHHKTIKRKDTLPWLVTNKGASQSRFAMPLDWMLAAVPSALADLS
jgi:hypothetical protein